MHSGSESANDTARTARRTAPYRVVGSCGIIRAPCRLVHTFSSSSPPLAATAAACGQDKPPSEAPKPAAAAAPPAPAADSQGSGLRHERSVRRSQRHRRRHAGGDRHRAARQTAARDQGEPRRQDARTSRSADRRARRPGPIESKLPPPDRSADGIGEVDADTYKVRRVIHAGNDPEQLDISADGKRLYVANEDAAQVSVVDLRIGPIVTAVKMGDEPEGVTIRPDGKVVYVTSEDEGAVYAIDTATNKVLKKVPVGHRPRSIGFLPDSSRAYVSLENDGAIAVIDGKQHKFLRLIKLEGQGNTPKSRPMGITVSPDGSTVYVTTGSFGSLFFVDPKTSAAHRLDAGRPAAGAWCCCRMGRRPTPRTDRPTTSRWSISRPGRCRRKCQSATGRGRHGDCTNRVSLSGLDRDRDLIATSPNESQTPESRITNHES